MLTRRDFCLVSGAAVMIAALPLRSAWAQNNPAVSFIQSSANQLLAAMRSSASEATRRQSLQPIVDKTVDVEGIGRFCLGRFWRVATPAQQQEYLALFHRSLLNSIAARLGDYQDVNLTIGRATPMNDDTAVDSTITASGKAPVRVQWVVGTIGGALKVVDVIAEGTSLRQTQRSDYTSFLDGHGGSVQSLIDALKRQDAQAS
jgi:phospholipid transport system substrate-binding protein